MLKGIKLKETANEKVPFIITDSLSDILCHEE